MMSEVQWPSIMINTPDFGSSSPSLLRRRSWAWGGTRDEPKNVCMGG